MHDLTVPFYNNGTVEEWLNFCQSLQAVITGQNIIDPQGMCAITKSILYSGTLTVFENAKGVNGHQSEQAYKKTKKVAHMHMFLLRAYITQTRYMCWTMMIPHDMSLCAFVAHVNKMNDCLEQFLCRDDGTPQVKLVEDNLMDTLENVVPESWQGEMRRQKFDCVAKGQAKFIQFCKCLELLKPL
eukprot:11787438-Ditylum_brightwellii.AAC.1